MSDKLSIEDAALSELLGGTGTFEKQRCPACQRPFSRQDGEPVCTCLKERALQQIFAEAGVPRGFWKYTMADWNSKQNVAGDDLTPSEGKKKEWVGNLIRRYIAAIPAIGGGLSLRGTKDDRPVEIKSLLLTGGNHTGRTFLAAVAVMETLRNHHPARFFEWGDLVNDLSEYENRRQQEEIAEHFRNTLLVILDNVRNETKWSPCFLRQFERICRLRVASQLPTILTVSINHPDEGEKFRKMDVGSGWEGLVSSCFSIHLPGKGKEAR